MPAGLTPAALQWRSQGRSESFRGHEIHLFERDGSGPLLAMLHGFPSSSFDWRALLAREQQHAVLAPDFLGFGLSAKPRDHVYSLFWQADLIEELVASPRPDGPVFVVAHDMGTSVATELLARDLEGRLGFELGGALLFNGSIVLDRASLTLGAAAAARPARGAVRAALQRAGLPPAVRRRLLGRPIRSATRRPPTSGR